MGPLQLPAIKARIREGKGSRKEIWDDFRKKYVSLTPEEWVRQHILHYLVTVKHYPASLIGVEVPLKVNNLMKRCDILACDRLGNPLLLVECKAPEVQISQDVFNQVAMYNSTFTGQYLVVTNGLVHYACMIDHANRRWSFLDDIPDFNLNE